MTETSNQLDKLSSGGEPVRIHPSGVGRFLPRCRVPMRQRRGAREGGRGARRKTHQKLPIDFVGAPRLHPRGGPLVGRPESLQAVQGIEVLVGPVALCSEASATGKETPGSVLLVQSLVSRDIRIGLSFCNQALSSLMRCLSWHHLRKLGLNSFIFLS
jgi:hypothetical protein